MKRMVLFLIVIAVFHSGCGKQQSSEDSGKVSVVTTLFPLHDIVRQVGGEHVDATLLLPPGAEPHSFEPSTHDIMKITRADVFWYTGDTMEPWVDRMLDSIDAKKLTVLDASVFMGKSAEHDHHHHAEHDHHDHGREDPHIWLDFGYLPKMVDQVRDALLKADPANAVAYEKNAEAYKQKITDLDKRFRKLAENSERKTIIYAGHLAFGRFCERYGLKQLSAYKGYSPDAEPSAHEISQLVQKMKELGTKVVYYEALTEPRLADVLAEETGAELLTLHAGANLSKNEFKSGKTFLDIMQDNLERLKKGLQ